MQVATNFFPNKEIMLFSFEFELEFEGSLVLRISQVHASSENGRNFVENNLLRWKIK